MLDIGWSEMAIAAVIALIVIGPKDLPRVLRAVGKWAGKARRIARDFQNSIDDMMRESEIDEIRKEAQSVASIDIKKDIENSIDPTGVLTEGIKPPAPEVAGDGGDGPAEQESPSNAGESKPSPDEISGPAAAAAEGDETESAVADTAGADEAPTTPAKSQAG